MPELIYKQESHKIIGVAIEVNKTLGNGFLEAIYQEALGVEFGLQTIPYEKEKPDLVLVVGDVNSTVACALVASKLHIKIAHVEAGLRSYDRNMPEEINRVLTDQISDYLFIHSEEAVENLKREGIPENKIYFVGNTMIESLIKAMKKAENSQILEEIGIHRKDYALLTLHRPSNVDNKETFKEIFNALHEVSKDITILFPAHPRTKKRMEEFGFIGNNNNGFVVTEPVGYFDFLSLEKNAKFVLTDSGGVQEETTFFQVPCITIRENTERPVTITEGTNVLTGADPVMIKQEVENILHGNRKPGKIPDKWDGEVSLRIVNALRNAL